MHYVVFFNWRSIVFPVYVHWLFKRSLYLTCSLCKRCTLQQGKSCFCFRIFLQVGLNWYTLQNRMEELYSFVRFLQVTTYAYYFCKDCDCRAFDYSFSTECPQCRYKRARHFLWWNRYIAKPLESIQSNATGRDAMVFLKHKILKNLLLKRTKKERATDLGLPRKTVIVRKDSLDVNENEYYLQMLEETMAKLDKYAQAGPLRKNYPSLNTRIQQALDHPFLVEFSETYYGCWKTDAESYTDNDKRHSLTKPTVKGFKSTSILNKIKLDPFRTSTKIEALSGVTFFQLVGNMSVSARDTAVTRFTEDPDCRILLASFKAGGVALNLIVVSHVFLMEPCSNPAVEQQAQDRVHRIGQHKPVRIRLTRGSYSRKRRRNIFKGR
ncbi:ATP-dependent helicase rhp16-like [Lycium barbarum]|uniref:ATP-dependent helicase rhp16-like n=1 Tax=Lycium barbarum TaxID=112863 RepID=UPI00293F0904|nr:ATP-dependent helicase rhp16-like [Lycium barbarum]